MVTLPEVTSLYVTLHPLTRPAELQYRYSVRLYGRSLERVATTDDLTDVAVSAWIQYLQSIYAPRTVSAHRDHLRSIWRFAAQRGISGTYQTIRRVPIPDPNPRAWSPQELHRLLACCDRMPSPNWWRAEILVGYETGLRRLDAQHMRRCQIHGCTITVIQSKTGRAHVCELRPETAELLLSLPGDMPLALPHSERIFYRDWARLRRLAGVSGGAHQWLRRSGATEIAIETHSLDAARQWLGHRSLRQVDHYIDRSRFHDPCRMPPRVA